MENGEVVEQFAPPVSDGEMGHPLEVGMWLFKYHVLAFELIGVLLLIALVGAVMVARDPHAEGRDQVEDDEPRPLPPAGGEGGQEVEA
jgi:hypothetical protein